MPLTLARKLVTIADGLLLHTYSRSGGSLGQRKEARINASAAYGCVEETGIIELHALDAQNLRRTISGAWTFDGLMDMDMLESALQRAVARYPVVAGWLEAKGPGMYMLRWDGAAAERGVVWVTATAAGSPPDVLDGLALLEECLLPPLRRHTLLAIQVTHFPESNSTMIVATVDHVCADMQSFMDFLAAWCNECSAAIIPTATTTAAARDDTPLASCKAASMPGSPSTVSMRPPPRWDRSALLASPWTKRTPPTSDDLMRLILGRDAAGGGSSTELSGGASSSGGSTSNLRISISTSMGSLKDLVDEGSLGVGGESSGGASSSGASDGSFWGSEGGERMLKRRVSRKEREFWGGPSVWETDPISRLHATSMMVRLLLAMAESSTKTWLIPRSTITALKEELAGAMPPAGGGKQGQAVPTANDLLSALLLSSMAWLAPERVAHRGGMTLNVVVNGRGRFGANVGQEYFGNNSFLVPVWVPANLLLAVSDNSTPAAAPTPNPTPELVAFVHTAVREALSQPDGIIQRRYEWMAKAQRAGVSGRVRACEAASLLDGAVTIDNVSNYPIFELRFGSKQVASSANVRFVTSPRLAWVMAATPAADRTKGGSSGDLRMSLPLKTTHWSRLAPWWAAAGLSCLQDIPTTHEAASHPASVRYTMSEITRTALAGF